ncbi:MAG: hypothetical protein MUC51_08995, partial [Anaerolineae bacterium]|nr:hypothetical protein [Anaerolineae bacterium]
MIVRAIVTAPPYAPYLDEVARHPLVCGLRLNTVMPLRGGPAETLARLARLGQPLWVDLKGRQLRVSHSLRVETPVDAYLSDGAETLRIAAVDGARLILEDGPHRL